MPKYKFSVILYICAVYLTSCSPAPSVNGSEPDSPLFSEEIQIALNHERNLLHGEMDNPVYLEILHAADEKKTTLAPEIIRQLDEQWSQTSPKDVLAQTLLNSACSNELRSFRAAHPEFAEIFITDSQGRNVCLTNKTSDYYQADEAWWINTHNSNDPYGLYSPIEFDESSSTESISLFLPVLDPLTGNKLGILKAVVKLSHLAEGL